MKDPTLSRIYGVGIVGVTPPSSWSVRAHIPALRARTDKFRIAGIANSSAESAKLAAAECGIEQAFASVDALCASPDVDIVVVSVRVDRHAAIVEKALAAGKHVFCEWPLGRSYEETRRLSALSAERGVVAFCGSQAIEHPTIRYAASLIKEGWLGQPLFVTVVADSGAWGAQIPESLAFAADESHGASLLTIPIGHTLIGLQELFGKVSAVFAERSTLRSEIRVIETGEVLPLKAPDNAIVGVTFASGARMSMHYRGGANRGAGFRCEIIGTEGELQITGPTGIVGVMELALSGARKGDEAMTPMPPPTSFLAQPNQGLVPDNVMGMYDRIHADLETGSHTAPHFADAFANHGLIDAIARSSDLGRRIHASEIDGYSSVPG